jgi:GTPase SAR1 family protein
MWSDNETFNDLVGFRVHADLVREVVTDAKLLPVTIGIFGDWGSGKTSIMQMLRRDLEPDTQPDPKLKEAYESIAVLYINGWLFEGYDDAKSALLTSILAQLAEHKKFGSKVRDGAAALLKRVNWMRVAKLGFTEVALPAIAAYATGGISAVPSLMSALTGLLPGGAKKKTSGEEDGDSENSPDKGAELEKLIKDAADTGPTDIRSFREDFGKMLKASTISSLVVLIDDLDRCSPERIIENLEAIKLFLNVEGTAFVIGADPRIVRHAIAVRYKDAVEAADADGRDEAERLITDYLEKLIQVPYHLPRLSPAEIETYITLLFCQRDLPEVQFQRCIVRCEEERGKNRYRSFGYGDVKSALASDPIPKALEDALTFSAGAASLITEGLKGNPRQVKRFLNAYLLRKKLAFVAQLGGIRDDVLIKLMLLEYAEEKRFRELYALQAAENGHPKLLQQLEAGDGKEVENVTPEWNADRIRRWAAMEPKLAEVDLSDYFWLARDRLASTLSGLTLVPPAVRRILDGLLVEATRRATAQAAKTLNADELLILHGLITRHVQRAPDQKKGYDAFRSLIEAGVESSKAFGELLIAVPLAKVPPALHADLTLLTKGRPDLAATFKPVFARFAEEKETRIGKAAGASSGGSKKH